MGENFILMGENFGSGFEVISDTCALSRNNKKQIRTRYNKKKAAARNGSAQKREKISSSQLTALRKRREEKIAILDNTTEQSLSA
jgi:hypothetical protein